MKSEIILEMLKNNKIEELKRILEKEVYKNAMKDKDEKSRYSAMQRFFLFSKNEIRECAKKPCKDIEYNGKLYNSFVDGMCFALTTESIGTMESYDNSKNDYFNIKYFIDFSGSMEELDLNSVLAQAKSKGYKFKKSELYEDTLYFLHYKNNYYKIALLDKAYSIINNNEKAEIYHSGQKYSTLFIKNNIGITGICPYKLEDKSNYIIIEI